MTTGMTKSDRKELASLARKRAKLLKIAVAERKAQLMADFESSLASIYTPNDDEALKQIYDAAEEAVGDAEERLEKRCRELGIPERFAPSISVLWFSRGENALAQRRGELRKVAKTRLEAMEKTAITGIERRCVETETQLIAGGLDTGAARRFFETMPTPEELMPKLNAQEIRALLSSGVDD